MFRKMLVYFIIYHYDSTSVLEMQTFVLLLALLFLKNKFDFGMIFCKFPLKRGGNYAKICFCKMNSHDYE